MLSHVQLFETPWTVAHQAPLSVGFSRQEYWSGLPLPSPEKKNGGKLYIHKVYHFHHVKEHNSMALSPSTLCKHHHQCLQEVFIFPD